MNIDYIVNGLKKIADDKTTLFYFFILVSIILLGLIGPELAPYPYAETIYANGQPLLAEPPSVDHPLGTTSTGQDVLSRVLVGARLTVMSGIVGGGIIITLGGLVGVTAGYRGGKTETILMRFTDLVYGIPMIPFAIVLLMFLGVGFTTSIVVIGLLLWRGPARILRSQVLQIKERPFIESSRAMGASQTRIVLRHIVPNIAPMAIMWFALGIGYTILIQAGLAFIGVSQATFPSWGIMIRNAYESGQVVTAWWWVVAPGILISLTVLSTIMFGRRYEELSGVTQEEEVATI